MKGHMLLKILLSGDGGQGIQLISDMLAQAAFANGFFISQIPNYGLEQRGGVSLSYLIISDQEINYPRFSKPDILLVMSEQARERTKKFRVHSSEFIVLDIADYQNFLEEQKIGKISYNIFFLGLISKLLAEKNILRIEEIFGLLEKKLASKSNWEGNKWAFEEGVVK